MRKIRFAWVVISIVSVALMGASSNASGVLVGGVTH